jgi:integrase
MTDLVQTLTFRHLDPAKAINPHRFRDLFAYAWLKDNPKDFLTLSKILWHKSVQVTIDTYGAEFDVASGVFATEVWSESWAA